MPPPTTKTSRSQTEKTSRPRGAGDTPRRTAAVRERVAQAAREHLGYEQVRPGQAEAVAAVLAGHDVLAVLPTGAGKTAIYQLAGLLLGCPVVVISPLVALQHDQASGMVDAALVGAALNSHLPAQEQLDRVEAFARRQIQFLILAPEQLGREDVRRQLATAEPGLLVVDEAHCVSSWGHDFRPDYLRLGEFARALGSPRVLALTATAAPPVREEIVSTLLVHDPVVLAFGYDRPNIAISVHRVTGDVAHKRAALLAAVADAPCPGIVYAATRRATEEVAAALEEQDVRAAAYHAGLSASQRAAAEEAFAEDRLDVIVATSAFGMGIDKPNVRFVFHHDASTTLDAYYQEVGRAGRDGAPAQACWFYRPEDVGRSNYFASGSGRHDADPEEAERRRRVEHSRVEMLRTYAEMTECRGRFLLDYFGEHLEQSCGHCDNCAELSGDPTPPDASVTGKTMAHEPLESERVGANTTAEPPRPDAVHNGDYPVDSRVRHALWGEGIVMRVEEDAVVVLFDDVGYKRLSLSLVAEGDLLTRAR